MRNEITYEKIMHLAIAFLCTTNRSTTMAEHGCDEWGLFKNPTWLLDHYFKNSGVQLSEEEKESIFAFIETRNGFQIMESFLCPINRNGTREEHHLSDYELLKNYEKLILHFVLNGGAKKFAEEREEFLRKKNEEEDKKA